MWPLEQSQLTFQAGSLALSGGLLQAQVSAAAPTHRSGPPACTRTVGSACPASSPLPAPSLVPTISTAPAFFTDRWEC